MTPISKIKAYIADNSLVEYGKAFTEMCTQSIEKYNRGYIESALPSNTLVYTLLFNVDTKEFSKAILDMTLTKPKDHSDISYNIARMAIGAMHPKYMIGYNFVSDAWMSYYDINEYTEEEVDEISSMMSPSDDPMKVEVVMHNIASIFGSEAAYLYEVKRMPHAGVILEEFTRNGFKGGIKTELGGGLASIFERADELYTKGQKMGLDLPDFEL